MERERSNQVSDLYQRALAHAPADRERFVREAAGGDEALRQEVESLLRFETVSEQFLERPALALAAISTARFERPDDRPHAGSLHADGAARGRWHGGGIPGPRQQARPRCRHQILPPHFTDDPERRARFAREARVLATLNHPQHRRDLWARRS